jgi:hypothetical protein
VYLRLGSKAVAGGVVAVLVACCSAACGRHSPAIQARWNITPSPPAAGTELRIGLELRDTQGRPVNNARLRLEAHMSHPGMTPVTSDVIERSPGSYEARVRLPMAGDWRLVVAGTLGDGSRVTVDTQVPGVLAAPAAGQG